MGRTRSSPVRRRLQRQPAGPLCPLFRPLGRHQHSRCHRLTQQSQHCWKTAGTAPTCLPHFSAGTAPRRRPRPRRRRQTSCGGVGGGHRRQGCWWGWCDSDARSSGSAGRFFINLGASNAAGASTRALTADAASNGGCRGRSVSSEAFTIACGPIKDRVARKPSGWSGPVGGPRRAVCRQAARAVHPATHPEHHSSGATTHE
jgi:hypothetical protein